MELPVQGTTPARKVWKHCHKGKGSIYNKNRCSLIISSQRVKWWEVLECLHLFCSHFPWTASEMQHKCQHWQTGLSLVRRFILLHPAEELAVTDWHRHGLITRCLGAHTPWKICCSLLTKLVSLWLSQWLTQCEAFALGAVCISEGVKCLEITLLSLAL